MLQPNTCKRWRLPALYCRVFALMLLLGICGGTLFMSGARAQTAVKPTAAPILLTPANGATSVAAAPRLTWNPVDGASSYWLQVSTSDSFTSFDVNRSCAGMVGEIAGLAGKTTYYWRVHGVNGAGEGPWSAVWSFTTGDAVLPPAVPTQVAPANSATDIARPVTFSWNAADRAVRYAVQVSTSDSFIPLIVGTDAVTTTQVTLPLPATANKFYWRVKAINTGGQSIWSSTWSFTTVPVLLPPATPELVSPATGAADITRPVTFIWNAAERAARYALQVSTSDSFSPLIISTDAVTTTQVTLPLPTTANTYFWRVKAINEAGTSVWSDTWTFATVPALLLPATPVLAAPANAANDITRPVTFSWNAAERAVRYALQVSTSASFSPLVIATDAVTTTQVTLPLPATANKYYWRVKAINEAGTSTWSATWSFTAIQVLLPPTTPVLVAPANAATDVTRPVTFIWNAAERAVRYCLQISTSDSFSPLILASDAITTTQVTLPLPAAANKYYWRVKAINEAGTSTWSATWSFTAKQVLLPPSTPVLVAPTNAATDVARPVTFRWNAAERAVRYCLQVSTSDSFSPLIIASDAITATQVTFPLPGEVNHFYWRVKAINEAGTSVWSPTWSFTMAAAPPTIAQTVLATPANEAMNVTAPVQLSWNAVTGATAYTIQVARDNACGTMFFTELTVTGTSISLPSVPANTTLYWRVKARNTTATGIWSATWHFTTAL